MRSLQVYFLSLILSSGYAHQCFAGQWPQQQMIDSITSAFIPAVLPALIPALPPLIAAPLAPAAPAIGTHPSALFKHGYNLGIFFLAFGAAPATTALCLYFGGLSQLL